MRNNRRFLEEAYAEYLYDRAEYETRMEIIALMRKLSELVFHDHDCECQSWTRIELEEAIKARQVLMEQR